MRLPPKCPICGASEKWNPSHQRFENPVHDMAAHGLARPESPRMETEDLMQLADAKVLDRIGTMREA